MYTILVVVHVLLAVALIALILLQHGRGADAGAAFGSGASATVFGARGSASFLTRASAVLATLFFLTSLTLATLAGREDREPTSVVDQVEQPPAEQEEAPGPAPPDVPADVPSAPGGE